MDEIQETIEAKTDLSENQEILDNFRRQKQHLDESGSSCIISDVTEEIQPQGSCETSDPPENTNKNPPLSNNISFDSENSESEKMSSSDTDILKKLEDSELLISNLKSELEKRDETISTLSQEKIMLEKEKQMVRLLLLGTLRKSRDNKIFN